MISSSGLRSILACRAPYFHARFGCQREEHVIRVGQDVRRIARFMVRLLPFVIHRLTALSFLAQGLTRIKCRAIRRLRIARFGQRRYCKVTRVRNGIFYRKGCRHHFARNEANYGGSRIKLLPSKDRLIRLNVPAFRTARAVNANDDFLGRVVNFNGSEVGLYVVLLRILLKGLRRFSFNLLRRIIRVRHLIRDLTLSVTNGDGRFAYRDFLYGSAYVMFSIYEEYRLATRLNGVRQTTRFLRFSPLKGLLLRNRSVSQLLVRNRVNGDKVCRLVSVFVR